MTIKGHVENGVVVLDEPIQLENGTPVTVEVRGRKELLFPLHPSIIALTGILPLDATLDEAKELRRFDSGV